MYPQEGRFSLKRSNAIQAVIRRARAQGRAEAVAIISRLCPETGVDELLSSSSNADAGDYSTYWNIGALRQLLCADAELCDEIDRLQGVDMQLHYQKLDFARLTAEVSLLRNLQNSGGSPATVRDSQVDVLSQEFHHSQVPAVAVRDSSADAALGRKILLDIRHAAAHLEWPVVSSTAGTDKDLKIAHQE